MPRRPRIVARHPAAAGFAAACAVVGLVIALFLAAQWAQYAVFAAQLGRVAATVHSGSPRTLALEFPFRGRTRRVCVSIGDEYLRACRALSTDQVFYSNASVRTSYVWTLVHDQANGPVVAGLADGLRGLKAEMRLDDDEYVELLACAVQSIHYGVPAWRIQMPAETLASGRGVCTDRSVLLASLLLHEGYDTVIWVFGNEHHVAVGVRGVGSGFHGTGYAYIETTMRAFVTDASGAYAAAGQVGWSPQMIVLGGTRRYGSDVAAQFITDQLDGARSRSSALSSFSIYARTAADPWRECYARLASEHARVTDLQRRIAASVDDRPAIYALLTASGLGR